MKFFDPKRHLPPGRDWENQRFLLILGHGLSLLSLICFFVRYFDSVDSLYAVTQTLNGRLIKELVPGRTVAPFWELMAGAPLAGAGIYGALMVSLAGRNYTYHTQDARSDYLMRRLPDRWEYHRRCLAVPILSVLFELFLFAIGIVLCWLVWRFATPAGHLPL